MNVLIDIIENLLTTQTNERVTHCNYDDNYYGDQVCVVSEAHDKGQ